MVKYVQASSGSAPTLRPAARPSNLLGTGFAVGDGTLVATNAHVVPDSLDAEGFERLIVFVGHGSNPSARTARVVATDPIHDLALLRVEGPAIPPLALVEAHPVREGEAIAFTGFPIGAVLGLHPVTHQGIISALTPTAIPAPSSGHLSGRQIRALKDPYIVYQLDATAYPGNSGSPVYLAESGAVVAVLNKVFVKQTKENVIKDPSAISYAIPIKYLSTLLRGQ